MSDSGDIKQGTIAKFMRKRTQLVGFETGLNKHTQYGIEFLDNAIDALESWWWKTKRRPRLQEQLDPKVVEEIETRQGVLDARDSYLKSLDDDEAPLSWDEWKDVYNTALENGEDPVQAIADAQADPKKSSPPRSRPCSRARLAKAGR